MFLKIGGAITPAKKSFDSITRYISEIMDPKRKRIGLLIDGPNVIRREFYVDLYDIKNVLKEYGNLKVGKVFVNQYATEKLIEAVENHGLEPIICSTDVDVRLAVEGMELVYNPNIDTIAIVTRDADFKPLLNKANENGKETIIFGVQPGFSVALKNSADYVILLENSEMPSDESQTYSLDVEGDDSELYDIEVYNGKSEKVSELSNENKKFDENTMSRIVYLKKPNDD